MALRRGFSRPSCYLFLTMVVVDSGSVREDECFDSAPFAFCLLTQLSLLFLFRYHSLWILTIFFNYLFFICLVAEKIVETEGKWSKIQFELVFNFIWK